MTALPNKDYLVADGYSKALFRDALSDIHDYLSGLFGTAGTQAAAQAAMMALIGAGVVSKSTTYAVVAADRGKVFRCSGTWTLSLLSAATAGNGFCIGIKNSGSGTITIAPNGTDTIDSATLPAGGSIILACTGSGWIVVGGMAGTLAVSSGGTGATTASAAAANLGVVKTDCGHGNIGSFLFGSADAGIASGGTVSGANLSPAGINYYKDFGGDELTVITNSLVLSGTWRCLGYSLSTNNGTVTLYQRIA